ncbi:MAG TPA: phospho-sugar mutase [Peptococcaceae bacterium]|jgi:phosphoglucomutase|nr:phospho-sugar mutase [Clostridia bacterium]HOB82114.1 phospho-sugar mutase [Peptococcaceae bacterium]HPZ70949.1 phospho-sugar mutase [Peptococcaceae bacterium]HQD54029.1 phospho-sugar mutase [Peptococcaceae bacterium]
MEQFLVSFRKWKENVQNNDELTNELVSIETDPRQIEECFCKYLEFGTGGMRGVIGAGTNRMNIYTIRKATQGLANYLQKAFPAEEQKVVIAYDSRYKSRDFALEAALVLANNRIKTYVFEKIAPTPLLSYAVVQLQATAGIVITASHNPKEYNGYKVYGKHGGQLTDAFSNAVTAEIQAVENEFAIPVADQEAAEKEGYLLWLDDKILGRYIQETKKLLLNEELLPEAGDLRIVYTPLHGTGLIPVTRLLKECGFSDVHVVKEQADPDPAFPTVVSPNPEERSACALAIDLARKINADLVLATDPDADRVAFTVRTKSGDYVSFTGNQTGALLIDYLLQMRARKNILPENSIIIKTIVTSEMGVRIAQDYGVKHLDVLTGFKYIGEKIAEFEETKQHTFLFGYEESYGYLIGSYVRDKDAVQTCLLLAEMALYYKKQGSDIAERLEQLYQKYGYFKEDLINITMPGLEGQKQLCKVMSYFRDNPLSEIKGYPIAVRKDYLFSEAIDCACDSKTPIELPCSNVLQYLFTTGAWCCIRPSGTEPKLKIYFAVKGKSPEEAQQQLTALKDGFLELINSVK